MCDLTACPHLPYGPPPFEPFSPDMSGSNDIGLHGYPSSVPLEFSRYELQEIRDKAQTLAEGMERGAERDALDALAKGADILDAIAARTDAEVAELEVKSDGSVKVYGYRIGGKDYEFEPFEL